MDVGFRRLTEESKGGVTEDRNDIENGLTTSMSEGGIPAKVGIWIRRNKFIGQARDKVFKKNSMLDDIILLEGAVFTHQHATTIDIRANRRLGISIYNQLNRRRKKRNEGLTV